MPKYEVLEDMSISGMDAKVGMIIQLPDDEGSHRLADKLVADGKVRVASDEDVATATPTPVYAPGVVPTVGRIVYYHDDRDFAAMVVTVQEGGSLVIAVFYESGVTIKKGVTQGADNYHWDWMPFQKDQQARLGGVAAVGMVAGAVSKSADITA